MKVNESPFTLTHTLVRNGYPRNFINPNKSKVIENGDAPHMVQKKPVFITLPFKGDSYIFTVEQHLKNFILHGLQINKECIVSRVNK